MRESLNFGRYESMTFVEVMDMVRPNRPMSEEEASAMALAVTLHHANGSFRRGTGEPYAVHLASVVKVLHDNLAGHRDLNYMMQAAWLHDLIEDVGVSPGELRESFGPFVANLVVELTEPEQSKRDKIGRAVRAAREAERLSGVSPQAQCIKYADIISNLSDFPKNETDFAKVYFAEKYTQLYKMRAGHAPLRLLAHKVLKSKKAAFGIAE